MLKYFLIIVALLAALQHGLGFIFSDKFQEYGDKKKAGWTCPVTNIIGEFYITVSKYERAQELFELVENRCPKTKHAEKASYQIAYCYEKKGFLKLAIHHYEQFAVKYPKSERAKSVPKKLQRLYSAK